MAAALGIEVDGLSILENPKEENVQKKWLLLLHGTPVLGLALPLCNILFPLFLWIHKREHNAIYDNHGIKVINFQISGIDFKTDGTYIFDNAAIGMSDYQYETYEIQGNEITLDKSELENVIKTNRLEIRPKTIEYSDRTETKKYVYQVNEKGEILKNKTKFRVIIDNRKFSPFY